MKETACVGGDRKIELLSYLLNSLPCFRSGDGLSVLKNKKYKSVIEKDENCHGN